MRKIQSFVRRSGRLSSSQKYGLTTLWTQYGIDLPAKKSQLKQRKLFAQSQPLILEIGFGNGQSLLQMAIDKPQYNYLGIEVYQAGIGRLVNQIHRHKLNNIKVLNTDSSEFLENYLDAKTLFGVQIFFPDPWHKTKHHKRRLIQEEFLNLLHQKLTPDGFLHIATDWKPYAEHIFTCLISNRHFKKTSSDTILIPRPDFRPITKFEKKGLKLGYQIYDFFLRKTL